MRIGFKITDKIMNRYWVACTRICFIFFCAICVYPSLLWAQVDPNVELSFSRIYVDDPQDTVDGAFKKLIFQAVQEVFAVNPRFRRVSEPKTADGILAVELSKDGPNFLARCKLILASSGEVFAIEEQTLPGEDEANMRRKIAHVTKNVLSRVPFYGAVTGRDQDLVTLDIGSYQGVSVGDIVQISRVDHIRRHPLLKQIIDVRLIPVGTAVVEEIEEGISFARVTQELPGERVLKFHKISGIERAATTIDSSPVAHAKSKARPLDPYLPHIFSDDDHSALAQYGYVSLDLRADLFSHSASKNTQAVTGGAFNPGFSLRGEVWFTSRIFADLNLGGSFMSYGINTPAGVNRASFASNTRSLGFNVGYRFLFDNSIYGPQLAGKIGYSYYKWQVPTAAEDLLTARTYKGLSIGILGTLPFGKNPYGALLDVGMLLFPSLTESTPLMGLDGSSTVARLFVGGYYYFHPRLSFRAGVHFESYSTDFSGATPGSTTQKNIGFVPSVQYYF